MARKTVEVTVQVRCIVDMDELAEQYACAGIDRPLTEEDAEDVSIEWMLHVMRDALRADEIQSASVVEP